MKIIVLPCDGIGPEVSKQAVDVLSVIADFYGIEIELTSALIGGAAIREYGLPLPDATLLACMNSDAVFLGAVGDPQFDDRPPSERPEGALLKLRKTSAASRICDRQRLISH